MRAFALFVFCSISCSSLAQNTASQDIIKGNDMYRQKQYVPAAAAYDEALAKDPENNTAKFNKANASYRMSKNSEAITSFEEVASKTTEPGKKSEAYYNKGVVLSSQKRLEESIEAYKNSLRQNPNDKEARENLQKALLELKKKEPPKKQNEKKQQQQNKQPQQPKMNPKDADQKLQLLQQKERDLQRRMQKAKSSNSGGGNKDW